MIMGWSNKKKRYFKNKRIWLKLKRRWLNKKKRSKIMIMTPPELVCPAFIRKYYCRLALKHRRTYIKHLKYLLDDIFLENFK